MSAIPANLARVPNSLIAQFSLASLTRTNLQLFRVQSQLSTGRAINRPSDDAIRAAAIDTLDERTERAAQRLRNLDEATTRLDLLDTALGDLSDIVLQAKEIASSQVGLGTTPEQRRGQAVVVDSLIDAVYDILNRRTGTGHLFGGSSPGEAPMQAFLGGFRYTGASADLFSDLGLRTEVPVGLGQQAVGTAQARIRGLVDLDPRLTADTRLQDVRGGRGLGVTPGPLQFSFDGGPLATVDLAHATSAGDVAAALTAAIRQYESDQGVTILGPGAVAYAGGGFSIDVVSGAPGPDPVLAFFDVGTGTAGQDLGLVPAGGAGSAFTAAAPDGEDLDPRLTWFTPVAALAALTSPLGTLRLSNVGRSRDIDLSGAERLQDIRNALEGAGLGVRVAINDDGTGLDVLNDTATSTAQSLSISDISGGATTAERLGIRSMAPDTRLSEFNGGRGVRIVDGTINPATGLPDPAADIDFRIHLGDGREVTVDLRPQDILSVQTLVDRINAEIAAQGVAPADLAASLGADANGIVLTQNASYTQPIRVEALNNSPAAEDLGLLEGTYDASSASLTGADRARVAVSSVLGGLIRLRDALNADDTPGITLAGGELEDLVDETAQSRALIGSYTRRVEAEIVRQEDLSVFDDQTRSQLRDMDFAEAATRFSQLQSQLQAGLQVTALASQRTLLDFLG